MEETRQRMAWEQAVWDELDRAQGHERMVLAAQIVGRMTQRLATELGEDRRLTAVALIESGQYTYQTLADSMGIRVAVAQRLVAEGRQVRLQRIRREMDAEVQEAA